MLASDPYLSHLVAATVQTAELKDIVVGPKTTDSVTASAPPSASAHSVPFALTMLFQFLVYLTLR